MSDLEQGLNKREHQSIRFVNIISNNTFNHTTIQK